MTHYSRQEWGGRQPRARYRLLPKLMVRGVALHWPAMAKPLTTVPAVMAALRGWQDYHMDTRGWSDIAYQVAVDQMGNSYGLRGLRYRSAANGGTLVNQTHGAILLVVAPGEAISARLIREVQRQVSIHQLVFPRSRAVVGHGDIRPEPTACPGPAVTSLIRTGAFTPPRK